MTQQPSSGSNSLDADYFAKILDDFRGYWLTRDGPIDFQPWLARAEPAQRPQLLRELLMLDAWMRVERDDYSAPTRLIDIPPLSEDTNTFGSHSVADQPTLLASSARDGLLSCPTFRALSRATGRALAARFQTQHFAAQQFLLRQGQPAAGLYLIVSGNAEVRIHRGREIHVLDRSAPGHLLGEMSLLTGIPCSADVLATNDVCALTLSTADYHALCRRHPELLIAISQLVSDRLGRRPIDALCGKVIGGYELLRCIKRGGMGVVYEARRVDDAESPHVALKMLRHQFIHEEEAIRGFSQESELLATLRHPHIVAVQAYFVALNTRFLVMQLCEGEDLARVLQRRGPLPEEIVRPILGQMASGLLHAHRQGVIHLDLKPSNVLLSRRGVVALTDFGLSRMIDAHDAGELVRGTPACMPPEQLLGEPLTPAADWYAFACTAYSLLTTLSLFDTRDMSQMLIRKSAAFPNASWPALNVSSELREIIANALHPVAAQRKLDLRQLATWAAPLPDLSDGEAA